MTDLLDTYVVFACGVGTGYFIRRLLDWHWQAHGHTESR